MHTHGVCGGRIEIGSEEQFVTQRCPLLGIADILFLVPNRHPWGDHSGEGSLGPVFSAVTDVTSFAATGVASLLPAALAELNVTVITASAIAT
jgi:hypothetical protein